MLTGRHLLDPPHQGAPVPLRGLFLTENSVEAPSDQVANFFRVLPD
jgi:hypothetical protein